MMEWTFAKWRVKGIFGFKRRRSRLLNSKCVAWLQTYDWYTEKGLRQKHVWD